MDTIATLEMALALGPLGILVPFHRFQSVESQIACIVAYNREKKENWAPCSAAIGIQDNERWATLKNYPLDYLFLDVAHAYTAKVLKLVSAVKNEYKGELVVGNVATRDAVLALKDAGADMIKIGVGCGSICTTRLVTGCGVPQVGALIECCDVGIPIIADGGIKVSGDIVKALVLGANAVMIGSLFAGTDESAGSGTGRRPYRGMASKDAQTDRHGKLPEGIVPEGISTDVPYRGPVRRVAEDLIAGLRQGMAMVGAACLSDLINRKIQVVSSATKLENEPHILYRR